VLSALSPVVGGGLVSLLGWSGGAPLSCVFGGGGIFSRSVSAFFLPDAVACRAPPGPAGFTTVELFDGTVSASSSFEFAYFAPSVLKAVSPQFATAGSVLQLYGSAFAPGTPSVCRVGATFGHAAVISSVFSFCEMPPMPGAVMGQLMAVEYVAASASVLDAVAANDVALLQAFDAPPSAAELAYAVLPVFEALRPTRGPARGGTPARLLGRGFANTPGLKCRFGAVFVAAFWLSEAELRCAAPAHAPGTVNLQVALSADDWTAPHPFLYYR
jgi:hypothetical protein